MIRIRTTQAQLEKAARLLLDALRCSDGEDGLSRVRIYSSATYRTELALSLTWDTASMYHEGSRVGLTISEVLKSFGLVEHSVWMERKGA